MTEAQVTTTQRSQRLISMRTQLLGMFTLVFTVFFLLAAFYLLQFIDNLVLKQIENDLTSTLAGAAANTNGDLLVETAREAQPNAEGYSDDPRYLEMMEWLEQIHDLEPRAWPFLYVPGENPNQIFYVVDLQARYEPTRSAVFMEENPEAIVQTLGMVQLTERPGDNSTGAFGVYEDDWGKWVTAYAPVKNAKGEVVGGMGLDFLASYVRDTRDAVQRQVIIAFVVIYFAMFLLIYRMTGSFTKPLIQLSDIADLIGGGDYMHQDKLRFIMDKRVIRDELSRMADAFSVMVDKVSSREKELRQQVQELKIEINDKKRKAQVEEIVESDFFKELKTKAGEMRNRMTGDESAAD